MNFGNLFSLAASNVLGHSSSTIVGGIGSLAIVAVQAWANAGAPFTASGAAAAVAPAIVGALLGPKK